MSGTHSHCHPDPVVVDADETHRLTAEDSRHPVDVDAEVATLAELIRTRAVELAAAARLCGASGVGAHRPGSGEGAAATGGIEAARTTFLPRTRRS
jgi:hypothetical protein